MSSIFNVPRTDGATRDDYNRQIYADGTAKRNGWLTDAEIDTLFPLPEPERATLAEALDGARAAIRIRRRQAEYGGFLFNGQRWDSEEKDEVRLNSIITMMDKTGITEFAGWKINADARITLTPDLAAQAAAVLMTHYAACFHSEAEKTALLAAYIESLGDEAAAGDVQSWLDANLDAGWPGEEG